MASARAPHDDLRLAAFARLRLLEQVYGDDIPWKAIERGFECNGERVLLANRAVSIFKPKQRRRERIRVGMPGLGLVQGFTQFDCLCQLKIAEIFSEKFKYWAGRPNPGLGGRGR